MKKTLPSLRVEEQTINNIKAAIKKYNQDNLFNISEAEFRRLAYEVLSRFILLDLPMPFKILKEEK